MEKIEQQERLPITEQQIKKFLGWYKKFSGKGKKVAWPDEKTETIIKSYEMNGKKYINAKNDRKEVTREYNPKSSIISVISKEENGPLHRQSLENDLYWFQKLFPSRKEKTKQGIKKVFNIN